MKQKKIETILLIQNIMPDLSGVVAAFYSLYNTASYLYHFEILAVSRVVSLPFEP